MLPTSGIEGTRLAMDTYCRMDLVALLATVVIRDERASLYTIVVHHTRGNGIGCKKAAEVRASTRALSESFRISFMTPTVILVAFRGLVCPNFLMCMMATWERPKSTPSRLYLLISWPIVLHSRYFPTLGRETQDMKREKDESSLSLSHALARIDT